MGDRFGQPKFARPTGLDRMSWEHRPLLVPEQRQFTGPLQSLGGESDGLGTVKNVLNQIGSQERELQRARETSPTPRCGR